MEIVIQPSKTRDIKPCTCGHYPRFVRLDPYHTDVWLQCPNCGKQTQNTGGFHYAMEIKYEDAKEKAVEKWNNGEFYDNSKRS